MRVACSALAVLVSLARPALADPTMPGGGHPGDAFLLRDTPGDLELVDPLERVTVPVGTIVHLEFDGQFVVRTMEGAEVTLGPTAFLRAGFFQREWGDSFKQPRDGWQLAEHRIGNSRRGGELSVKLDGAARNWSMLELAQVLGSFGLQVTPTPWVEDAADPTRTVVVSTATQGYPSFSLPVDRLMRLEEGTREFHLETTSGTKIKSVHDTMAVRSPGFGIDFSVRAGTGVSQGWYWDIDKLRERLGVGRMEHAGPGQTPHSAIGETTHRVPDMPSEEEARLAVAAEHAVPAAQTRALAREIRALEQEAAAREAGHIPLEGFLGWIDGFRSSNGQRKPTRVFLHNVEHIERVPSASGVGEDWIVQERGQWVSPKKNGLGGGYRKPSQQHAFGRMEIVAHEPGVGTARVKLLLGRSKVADTKDLAAQLSRRIRSTAARRARRAGRAR